MIRLAAPFVVSWLTGLFLTGALWPREAERRALPLKLFLGMGLGLGVSACVHFAWIACGGKPGAAYFAADAAVLAVAAGAFAASRPSLTRENGGRTRWTWRDAALGAALGAAFGASVVAFATLTAKNPYGEWDAVSVWNKNAVLMHRAGGEWPDAYRAMASGSQIDTPVDYPLLVPSLVARVWAYSGEENPSAPAAVAGVFALLTAGLLGGALYALKGKTEALLGPLLLFGTPFFTLHAAALYADVEVAYYLLAALAVLSVRGETGGGRRLDALCGVAAGFAAWTKNEGLLFIAALVLAGAFRAVRTRSAGEFLKRTAVTLAGALPGLLAVVHFKTGLATVNKVLATSLEKGSPFDPGRWSDVAREWGPYFLKFGEWTIVPLSAAFAAYVLWRRAPKAEIPAGRPPLWTVMAVMLAGFAYVYLVTPYSIEWHVSKSAPRLLLQLWPAVLFAGLLSTRRSPSG